MKRLAVLAGAAGLALVAVFWLWISLSLPFDDLNECGGGGALWIGFQLLQKLVAAAGAVGAAVCVYGAGRYVAARGGVQFFFMGGAAVSFTFFAWILLMGIGYSIVCG